MKLHTTRSSFLKFILASLLVIQLAAPTVCFSLPDGDVDGNGRVTGADALLILRAYIGLDPVTPQIAAHGIISRIGPDNRPHPGGSLSLIDPLLVLQKAIGLINWDFSDPEQVNQVPIANAGSNQTITLNPGETSRTVTLTGSGTDPGGTIASYAWSGTPTPAATTNPGITLGVGTHTFTLVVTDNLGAQSAASSVTITVNAAVPGNQTPIANAGSNQTITLNPGETSRTVTLTGSGTDPDGTIASFLWSGTPKPADTAGSTVSLAAGTYIFTLVTVDNQGAQSAPSQVTIVVNPSPALAPVITTLSLPFGRIGSTYGISVTASDPAGSPITYTLEKAPAGMTINSSSGLLSWQPAAGDIGTIQIVVVASNPQGGVDRRSYNIAVPDTIAPSVSLVSPPVTVLQNSTTPISATAADNKAVKSVTFFVDGVQKAVVTAPPYLFDLIATEAVGSVLTVRAVAEDTNGNTAIAEAGITVYIVNASNPNNQAPRLGTLDLTSSVAEGGTLTIPVTASDSDAGDVVTLYAATTPPSLAHTLFSTTSGSGTFTFTPDNSQAGSYSVTFRAVDPFGLTDQKTVQITVTDVNRPPAITTQSLANGRVDYPYSAKIVATDPDSDPLTFSLSQGPTGMTINAATGLLSWRPVIADIGDHTVEVAVSDGKGVPVTKLYTLQLPDSIPPAVSLSAPKEAIPGATFKVVATATDNKAVSLVTLAVAGQAPVELTAAPYELQVTLPDTLAVGTAVALTATAKDAAGNSSSAAATVKIVAVPDTVKPTVSLTAPATVSPGSRITLTAVASDNQGVATLDFYADGVAVGRSTAATPSASYVVPANAVVGAGIIFSVTATDFSANSASAQSQSTVVAPPVIPDTVPPTVTLSVPSSIAVGSLLPVTISASDDRGVASVELLLAHNRVAYFTNAVSQTITLPLPDGAAAGMELVVELQTLDQSGNPAGATATVTVVTRGQGVLTGAVYDDVSGQPLSGATVTLALSGQTEQSATTDSHGRYSFVANEGTGGLIATKAGYNRVDRSPVAVMTGTGRRVADARLTPLPATGTALSAVLGGTVVAPFTPARGGFASAIKEAGIIDAPSGGIAVTLPSGALSADQSLILVQTGAQGLQGTLPAGWSPVAAFDLQPHGINFAAPVAATVPNLLGLPATAGAVVARWDEAGHAWLTVGAAAVAADGATLGSNLSTTGQYVFLTPDAGSGAPSAPAAGAPLSSVPLFPLGQDLQAQVTPQPKLIFYKPGVSSTVGSRVAAAKPLVSGTPVWATIAEDYRFYSGDRIVAEPYAQDIVLYTFGLPAGELLADYPVAPGQDFTGQLLEKGVISVTTSIPPANADVVTVVGPQGGVISAAGSEALIIPAGAVSRTVPVTIKPFDLPASGLTLPPGFTLLGGVTFSMPGSTLQAPVALSLPLPGSFTEAGDILLVRPVAIGGSTHFAVIGRGTVNSGRLLSTVEVTGSTTALFPGITTEGSVFFLQSAAGLGYAGGTVSGTTAAPFSGALISSDTLPLVAVSGSSGGYVTVVTPGAFTLTARDTVKMDTGSATGTVLAGAFAAVNLSLAIDAPRIVAVTPANNAINVALTNPVVITLSEPVVAAGPANVQVTSAAGSITGSVDLSVDGTNITFRHPDLFASNTLYTVTVTGLTDRSGTPMTAPFSAAFTSLNTDPPVAPPAGNVTATIPATDGTTTVVGTQGSAGLHDTVTIVNLTTGARNQVLVDPNGSFTGNVAATAKDKLQLEITSPAGITTTVTMPRFRQVNADGSITEVVGSEGGTVTGPEGIQVEVPIGAFDNPTLIRLKPVSEAAFPVQLSDTDKKTFAFSGGIDLDLGTEQPKKYLNVSIPTKGGETLDDQWVLTKVVELDGVKFMHPVDTARVIGTSIRTSSPPCPGVTGSAVYGFLKSSFPVGVVYGQGYDESLVAESFMILANEDLLLPYKLFQPDAASDMIGTAREITRPFCIPIPSGRSTVTLNTVTVTVRKSVLRDADTELVITNPAPALGPDGLKWRFARNQLEFSIKSQGVVADTYTLTTVDSTGAETSVAALAYKVVESDTPGFVTIKIPISVIPATAVFLRVDNPSATGVTSLLVSDLPMTFQISGGTADRAIKVEAINAITGLLRPVSRDAILIPSSSGTGRLLLQVIPGTIDPTPAQIAAYNAAHPGSPILGKGVIKVEIFEGAVSKAVIDTVADPTVLLKGGMTYTFDGDPAIKHSLDITYEDFTKTFISIPLLALKIRSIPVNPATPPKVITFPAPPRNNPLVLPPLVTGNRSLSVTEPADLNFFDPTTGLLTFTFSRSMDVSTMNNVHIDVYDAAGIRVTGELRVSDRNRKITFVPQDSLIMGVNYTINLSGLMDLNGTLLPTRNFTLTATPPTKAFTINQGELPSRTLEPLIDVAIAGKNPTAGNVVIGVADLPSGPGYKLMAFSPLQGEFKEVGNAAGGGYRKRVHTVENVTLSLRAQPPCSGPHITGSAAAGYTFTGNIAIGISSAWNMSFVTFYDITTPKSICVLGGKLLATDSSNINSYTQNGTIHSFSLARGVTTVKSPGVLMAYVALDSVGVMRIDVGNNIPEILPADRKLEAFYSGSFRDIVNVSDRLVIADGDTNQLTVLDPNLTPLTTLPLKSRPSRLAYAGSVARDLNQNGVATDPGEVMDLLFVGEDGRIELVDVSNPASISSKGTITAPGNVSAIDVDLNNSRLLVLTNRNALTLFNLSSLWTSSFFDGREKKLWNATYPPDISANAVKVDPDTGDFFVGTSKGLEIYRLRGPNLVGEATYTFYEAKPAIGLDWGHPEQRPIRGAIAELIEDTPAEPVLDTVNTDERGRFAFFNAPLNKDVKVKVHAKLGKPSAPNRIRVVDYVTCGVSTANPSSNCPAMNITSPAVKITAGNRVFLNMSTQQKVLRASQFMTMSTAAREADPGPSYNIRDASPFAILDTIYHAENFMKKRVNPNLIFPPMVVAFNTSNSPSTSWTSSLKQLNVNGNINKDSDEYDRVIILHEWLHYFQELFLRSDTTSGGHSSGEHVDPTLAFNEAISTSFGAIMNESNWYVDTSANGSHGGGAGCIVHAGGAADTDTCSNVEKDGVIKDDSGSFCEDCSIEMIWDLFDSSDPGNAAGKPLDPDTDGFIAVDMPTDLIELDFKKITDAALMIKPKRAFNTIVSYLNDVRSLLPFGAAENIGILDLAKGEGINLTVGDTYEPSGDRLYNVITVGTPLANFNTQAHEGEILKTLDENDISCNACEGNKFGEFIYFKFTVPPGGAGKYAVSIIPADRSWIMGCELIGSDATKTFYNRKDGTIFPYNGIGGTFPTGILSFQTPILSEGDTFLRVNSAVARPSGVRSGKTSVWPFTYAPATFSILVEKAP